MDILTWIVVIIVGLILIKIVGKLLKFFIGIGLLLFILYVVSSFFTDATSYLNIVL
ncbi:hypothetical protein LGQ02_09175 [Bacillus shivajii]|uniref:hypothetical protein n=1 Tax=Bacillus shivajii TaxID=1983719 RepID=UPI001CFB04D6|nr:hypothetical protein [Bacillus shivajii]UCZ54893.1 hypothetical protein LGQ02_09175 [Bacillus shivajii]